MTVLRIHRPLLANLVVALTLPHAGAFAQPAPAKAETRTSRNPDGSTRITIKVDPGDQHVKDVHLCVARTTHTPNGETTNNGDPIGWYYYDPRGQEGVPQLPEGWEFKNLVESQEPPPAGAPAGTTTSKWCLTWTATPGVSLERGHPTTFVVDYYGDKGDVGKSAKENLFVTKGGTPTFAAGDVLNGPGTKGEKGHMPKTVFPATAPPLISFRPPEQQQQQQQRQQQRRQP